MHIVCVSCIYAHRAAVYLENTRIKTCKNNERINNVSAEFCYAETDGKVTLDLMSGKTVTMRFGKNAVCVYDCYLYDNSDAAEILLFVRRYGQENGVTFARKNTELLGEFTLHNSESKNEEKKRADTRYNAGEEKR